MEKRNIIESGRTPDMTKQANVDTFEKDAVAVFDKIQDKKSKPEEQAKKDGK